MSKKKDFFDFDLSRFAFASPLSAAKPQEPDFLKYHEGPRASFTKSLNSPDATEKLLAHTERGLALWNLSERILKLLRTSGIEFSEEDIRLRKLHFAKHYVPNVFPELDPQSLIYLERDNDFSVGGHALAHPQERPLVTPNFYFQMLRPDLIDRFGFPFYTVGPSSDTKERIIGINTAFFAGVLHGDPRLDHQVVYFLPEDRFYFYDLRGDMFFPTQERNLRTWLYLMLQDRAGGLAEGQARLILHTFRTKAVFDDILEKAKALWAVDSHFFREEGRRRRFIPETKADNVQLIPTIRSFVEQQVVEASSFKPFPCPVSGQS